MKYQNQGIGMELLKHLVNFMYIHCGRPNRIEYIWNGANSYVFDWMEKHFSPISKCPIAVLKTSSDDDWDSHIYYLDIEKFLSYFSIL